MQGDIQSVGEFIRLYLTRHERWASPLFLVGESYGTTRAAGLSGYLVDRGIAFNGIVLVSSILNFQTARFTKGNDLPFVLFLPTYAATAWYHKQLPADLQAKPLKEFLAEVEQLGGDRVPRSGSRAATRWARPSARRSSTGWRATPASTRSTWTTPTCASRSSASARSCCASDKRTVGRLDSRFKGMDLLAASERPDFDPSMAAIRPPYTAMFNDYVRRSLGFKSDLTYHILGGGIGAWDWGSGGGGGGSRTPARPCAARSRRTRT